ncbi:IpaD/SipD/SspD family type III secretion system needle tip protein [Morganella morganii]|uniref:IpaD/SipD/SspD family type III secretion system needle tip protein n=3 Tax=Morganella morganii TaxID=582 RepID=UPI001C45394D|nr:IpaD/SipD/SspD family type III secretion system needle tip protein [Morganella morganii]QXO57408.1 IpaD/SipD/SspD family type III secretion system needle tip protein [Morganella morganii]
MKRPVSGTQVIKKINTETDSNGKLVKVVGSADVIAIPEALFRWLDIFVKNENYDEINSNFDISLEKLKEFNLIDDDYSSVSSLYKNTLEKISETFNDKLKSSYFEKAKSGINEEWELDHGKINSYNTIMDGIKKELQMTLDEFSQRYNTINSNYDNMLRVITTMISELTQELKGFLRI